MAQRKSVVRDSRELGHAAHARHKKPGCAQVEIARFGKCGIRFVSDLERVKGGIDQIVRIIHITNDIGLDLAALEKMEMASGERKRHPFCSTGTTCGKAQHKHGRISGNERRKSEGGEHGRYRRELGAARGRA